MAPLNVLSFILLVDNTGPAHESCAVYCCHGSAVRAVQPGLLATQLPRMHVASGHRHVCLFGVCLLCFNTFDTFFLAGAPGAAV